MKLIYPKYNPFAEYNPFSKYSVKYKNYKADVEYRSDLKTLECICIVKVYDKKLTHWYTRDVYSNFEDPMCGVTAINEYIMFKSL
jgi:hypothetical protein